MFKVTGLIYRFIPLRFIYAFNMNCVNQNVYEIISKTMKYRHNIKLELLGRYSVTFYKDIKKTQIPFDFLDVFEPEYMIRSYNLIYKLFTENIYSIFDVYKIKNTLVGNGIYSVLISDMDHPQYKYNSLLQSSIKNSQIKLFYYLFDNIFKITPIDSENILALDIYYHCAIKSGNIEIVKFIVNRSKELYDYDFNFSKFLNFNHRYIGSSHNFIIRNAMNDMFKYIHKKMDDLSKEEIIFLINACKDFHNFEILEYILGSVNLNLLDSIIAKMFNLQSCCSAIDYIKNKKILQKICDRTTYQFKYINHMQLFEYFLSRNEHIKIIINSGCLTKYTLEAVKLVIACDDNIKKKIIFSSKLIIDNPKIEFNALYLVCKYVFEHKWEDLIDLYLTIDYIKKILSSFLILYGYHHKLKAIL